MAKYAVTRACGHEETVALFGRQRDRDWRLVNVEEKKLCYDCYQAELAKQRAEAAQEAAEAAKEMHLPALIGTEKQVAWAETIRQQLLGRIDELIYDSSVPHQRDNARLLEAVEHIKAKVEARWWIDHRFANALELQRLIQDAADEAETARVEEIAKPIADQAKIEATVRPENPLTETVAEIRVLADAFEVDFPERRDDFWQIVKKQLKMEWSGRCWRRELGVRNGSPADRAAEAGHRLLAAGFIVRIYDPELRRRAIAGEYETECTRWITARTAGKYTGWFVIRWSRDEDFYRAARRIAGSRYDQPNVVAPPEQYEEVLDFAQRYGFRLSDGAKEVVEAARQAKENTLVAKVEPPAKREKIVVGTTPPALEVPQEVEVDDALRDDD